MNGVCRNHGRVGDNAFDEVIDENVPRAPEYP